MIATNSLSSFHHWLFSQPDESVPSRTIVLHGEPQVSTDHLVEDIAGYLNEYDEEGAGRWLAATSEIVVRVSANPDSRKLLGMADPCPNCPPDGPCGIRKTLNSLGLRGYIIFRSATSAGKVLELPDAFHAGVGNRVGGGVKFHLVLNPELMPPRSMAHIIGDAFLDWRHEEARHGSRNAPSSAIKDQT